MKIKKKFYNELIERNLYLERKVVELETRLAKTKFLLVRNECQFIENEKGKGLISRLFKEQATQFKEVRNGFFFC